MKNEAIIKVSNLKKVFRVNNGWGLVKQQKTDIVALDSIDFQINKGEFVALLGPNGAGKSTLIKILIGVLAYNEGQVEVMGIEPLNNREKIISRLGIVFGQRSRMWHDLPVSDSFELTKRLYGNSNKDWEEWLLDNIGVRDLLGRQVKKLSLGEKMRCELVNTLLYNPDLIFLDEPTIGLDVISKQRIREALMILHQKGKTILLTSHDTGDIEKLCQRVMVINQGKLAVDLTMDKFMKLNDDIEIRVKLKNKLKTLPKVRLEMIMSSEYEVTVTVKRELLTGTIKTILDNFQVADLDFSAERVEKILMSLYKNEK